MMDEGDPVAAADLFGQVVERVPAWAPGWAALAEARERGGDTAGARTAWTQVLSLDPEARLGAVPHLARLDGRTPAALPAGYLRALFDDYAPRFDRHLVEALHYRGPATIVEALDRTVPVRRFRRALDLGCGTGLMGRALQLRVERIDGVDLSPAMIEQARSTGLYADLTAGPLEVALLESDADVHDLVVAADVLIYLGDLAPVFAGAARAMAAGGVLAFTVQTIAVGAGFVLGPDMRFGHAPDHVNDALVSAGLRPLLFEPRSIRCEKGLAVPGLVVVAAR